MNLLITRYGIGDTVTNNDAKLLAEKIKHFAENPEILKECQKKARKIAEDVYSIPAISNGYKDIFDELIKNIDKA